MPCLFARRRLVFPPIAALAGLPRRDAAANPGITAPGCRARHQHRGSGEERIPDRPGAGTGPGGKNPDNKKRN